MHVQAAPPVSATRLCAGVEPVLRTLVAAYPPANSSHPTVIHGPDTLTFRYEWARDSAPGCSLLAAGSDTVAKDGVIANVDRALQAAGWLPVDTLYMADGPDGSMRGFVKDTVLCLRDESWDGLDDSDSTYVPKPDFTVGVRCAPRRADDHPPP